MRKKFKIFMIWLLLSSILLIPSCGFLGDPMLDDLWSRNIYPGTTNTYDIGSPTYQYKNGYFQDLFIGGVPAVFGGGGDVVGTPPSTDHAIARYDGVTGLLIQNSPGVTIDDFDNLVVDSDIDTVTGDINSGNDVNVTNDLDVTDNGDIGGDLVVVGSITGANYIGIDADMVEVEELGVATYDDAQDYINFFGDRTLLTGGDITDNGDNTAAIASLTAWSKETDSETAVGKFFNFAGGNTAILTDLTTNYVYIDYNGGTPQIVVSTSITTHGFKLDHILVGSIFRDGSDLHWHEVSKIGVGRVNRTDMHHREEHPVHRVDGIVTSSVGTRNLGVTAGVLYEGLSRHTTLPFTTPNSGTADATEANKLHDADGGFATTDVGKTVHNTTDDTYAKVTAFVDSGELTLDGDIFISGENYDLDIFSYWYTTDSGATWTEDRGATTISNTQYNDITAGLANLIANRYGVHWVYMEVDGEHIHVVYGQGNYKVNEAEEATPPSIMPNVVTNYSALIAKIIVQKNTDTLLILYPWTTVLTSSLATDHGSLGGLPDDDHPQYILEATFDAKGNLLSASADDTPLILTVGGDGEVLTADSGEATGLIWSPAGDGATKEFFVPVNRADDMNQTSALPGGYINAAGESAWVAFHIPHDFNSITEAVVLINPIATATHRFDIISDYAAVGEAYETHSGSDLNHDFSMTALQFYEIDVSGILSSLSADDYGGIMLSGDATNTPNALVIGFRLKYT
ncbi:hypothetical protein LCGC14_1211260 [marine sediment metagenome]|uniref:Uncharacterized protein n=1 Tax=marine sediment metagenome TaxID=412755 RepID=A0A0F9PIK2_9ZZZZ